jgi:hypothetical protein
LFGGFASTIFWPIGHALNAGFGWRDTLVIYAVVKGFSLRRGQSNAEFRQSSPSRAH